MKKLILTAMIAFFSAMLVLPTHAMATNLETISAKKKSEPAPKDPQDRGEERGPRDETYEGNDRNEGGSFDGGGYNDGSGMAGEVFYVKNSKQPKGNVKVEDRGATLVYIEVSHEDIDASETCTTITRTTIDKASGKVIATDKTEYCNNWPL